MATKFETQSAITRIVYEITRRSLRITGVFGVGLLKDARKRLRRPPPRCYDNEIWNKIVSSITRFECEISLRSLRPTRGFVVGLLNVVTQIQPRPTRVAMETKWS